jgi:hypothetical protein
LVFDFKWLQIEFPEKMMYLRVSSLLIYFMKKLFILVLITASVVACKPKSEDNTEASEALETSPNEALYNEVMKIHDEVMPKMNDIYKYQQQLKDKLKSPNLSAKDKEEINAVLSKLDSAGNGMMVWMRQFDPIPDSVGEEKARIYLEGEMEKVKRVREDIAQALEQAKAKQ